jgi:hypothetical protein
MLAPDNGALLFLKLLSDYLTGSDVVKLLCYSSRDGLTAATSRARPEVPEVRARYAGERNAH